MNIYKVGLFIRSIYTMSS